MKTLAERLVWARTQKQLSQEQLAKLAGVSQSTIGNLEAGLRQTARRITAIADALEVNPSWLADGTGDPGASSGASFAMDDVLPKEGMAVHAYDPGGDEFLPIKVMRLTLSAGISGYGVEPDTSVKSTPIVFQREWMEKSGLFAEDLIALKVRGDSMDPSLRDGDLVVINVADKVPKDGLVYAVNYEGEDVVKRLVRENREWWLVSDNPDQKTYSRKLCRGASCIIIGQVIYKQSRTI